MPLPNKKTSFKRTTAKQKVYQTVKDWIIEGQFKPGEKISDVDIADYFQISRTPVREAFQLLESQKLVKSFPGKATVVTELETENIEKWYLPMSTLQQLAVTQAAEKVTEDGILKLKKAAEHFNEAIKDQLNAMEILKADKEFHSIILKMAENEYIVDFCDVLWIHIQRLEYRYFKETSLEDSTNEHECIIQALERKDSYAASLQVKNHWDRTALMIKDLNK